MEHFICGPKEKIEKTLIDGDIIDFNVVLLTKNIFFK